MYHASYFDNATIFALSTAKGQSAIAIIRVCGERTRDVLLSMGVQSLPAPRQLALRKIIHPEKFEVIDKAGIIWLPAPHNYTGDDMAELHLHGSRSIVNDVLAVLSSLEGLRAAEPGEFTYRAYKNGKMDLMEAEAVQDVIEADTWRQRKQALAQLDGMVSNFYEKLKERLVYTLSMLEAYIDFPEEDIPSELVSQMDADVRDILNEIVPLLHERATERLREGVKAVIMGPPNAGKSTLMNYLSQRDVAIVSEHAGTTRDALEVHLDINGYPLTLIDTAGIHESSDPVERMGINRAKSIAEQADLKILMFDAAMFHVKHLDTFDAQGESIILLNKADTIKENTSNYFKGAVTISLKKEINLESFWKVLEQKLEKLCTGSSLAITNARHRFLLGNIQESLDSYLQEDALELKAECIRLAVKNITKMTSGVEIDDLLENIFRKFCIGK